MLTSPRYTAYYQEYDFTEKTETEVFSTSDPEAPPTIKSQWVDQKYAILEIPTPVATENPDTGEPEAVSYKVNIFNISRRRS